MHAAEGHTATRSERVRKCDENGGEIWARRSAPEFAVRVHPTLLLFHNYSLLVDRPVCFLGVNGAAPSAYKAPG